MYNFDYLLRKTFIYKNANINLDDYVVFIENNNQQDISNYIKLNYEQIKSQFRAKGKYFLFLSDIKFDTEVAKEFKYRYPRLNGIDFKESSINFFKEFLSNSGEIKSGLLSFNSPNSFIEFKYQEIEVFKLFISDFLDTIETYYDADELPMFFGDHNNNIKLDDDTQRSVDSILQELSFLQEKGELLKILPIVEKYIKSQKNVNIDDLSRLEIDNNFKIYLSDYDIEIKLSHLTKSIYLLFLNHSEGITLSDLKLYKEELLGYYIIVSNREDYDKMIISINDIVNLKTNSIYVHLSRIKSVFTKVLYPTIADNYIINGAKSKPKKILLQSSLINFNSPVEKTIISKQ